MNKGRGKHSWFWWMTIARLIFHALCLLVEEAQRREPALWKLQVVSPCGGSWAWACSGGGTGVDVKTVWQKTSFGFRDMHRLADRCGSLKKSLGAKICCRGFIIWLIPRCVYYYFPRIDKDSNSVLSSKYAAINILDFLNMQQNHCTTLLGPCKGRMAEMFSIVVTLKPFKCFMPYKN